MSQFYPNKEIGLVLKEMTEIFQCEVELHYQGDVPKIFGEKNRIKYILGCLVNNAFKRSSRVKVTALVSSDDHIIDLSESGESYNARNMNIES